MGLADDMQYEVKFKNEAITTASTDVELIPTPGVGKTIIIDRLIFSSDSTASNCSLTLKSNAVIVCGPLYWPSPDIFDSKDAFGLRCNPGSSLTYSNTMIASGNISINVKYHIQG